MYILDKSKKVFDVSAIGQNDIFCVYIDNKKCILIVNVVTEEYLDAINCFGSSTRIYPKSVQSIEKLYDFSEE